MPHPGKRLAQLAIKGQDPVSMQMPPGGAPGITPQDIAAALSYAKVSHLAECIGRAKYADSDEAKVKAKIGIHHRVVRQLRKWNLNPTPDFSEALTDLLIEEYIDELNCKRCQGVGEIVEGKPPTLRKCRRCDGTGRRQLSERDRADRLNLSRDTWRRYWPSRYDQLAEVITDAEREVLAAMHTQFAY